MESTETPAPTAIPRSQTASQSTDETIIASLCEQSRERRALGALADHFAPIHVLPDELLYAIFYFLPLRAFERTIADIEVVSRTCARWRAVSLSCSSLWVVLNIGWSMERCSAWAARSKTKLLMVSFVKKSTGETQWPKKDVDAAVEHVKNLAFTFPRWRSFMMFLQHPSDRRLLFNTAVSIISISASNLVRLDLYYILNTHSYHSTPIWPTMIRSAFPGLQTLKSYGVHFESYFKSISNLTHLDLQNLHVHPRFWKAFLARGSNLEHLSITGVRLGTESNDLSQPSRAGRQLSKLHTLILCGCGPRVMLSVVFSAGVPALRSLILELDPSVSCITKCARVFVSASWTFPSYDAISTADHTISVSVS